MTRRFVILFLLGIVAGLAGLVLLPHERYWRWQVHQLQNVRKADWIYERLHFDPAPVDVGLIGTSRMNGGISGPGLERAYCRITGRRIHAANISLPQFGRNLDYVLAKELFATKSPELIVLQASEVEGRRPHPAFLTLADPIDILTEPMLINLDWAENLANLPGRQMALFLDGVLGRPTVRAEFDAGAYAGSNLDDTDGFYQIDGTFQSQDRRRDPDTLRAEAKRRLRGYSRAYLLPKPLRPLEYRLSRVYLDKIYAMAAEAGTDIAFAYMPAFTFDKPLPAHIKALTAPYPVFNVNAELIDDPAMWLNTNHVNQDGSVISTRRLAADLAAGHPGLGTKIADCAALSAASGATQGHAS